MNKELNIGDYCYIKGVSRDYGIGKITQLNSGYSSNGGELIDIQFKHSKHSVPKKDVISSHNILDLIEYDDILKIVYEGKEYICKVVSVTGVKGIQLTSELSVGIGIVEASIKSIVTHEMFESMEYKIGE